MYSLPLALQYAHLHALDPKIKGKETEAPERLVDTPVGQWSASLKSCNQSAVPPVFLDRMLETHGTSGMLRDKSTLLRVSYKIPSDYDVCVFSSDQFP